MSVVDPFWPSDALEYIRGLQGELARTKRILGAIVSAAPGEQLSVPIEEVEALGSGQRLLTLYDEAAKMYLLRMEALS